MGNNNGKIRVLDIILIIVIVILCGIIAIMYNQGLAINNASNEEKSDCQPETKTLYFIKKADNIYYPSAKKTDISYTCETDTCYAIEYGQKDIRIIDDKKYIIYDVNNSKLVPNDFIFAGMLNSMYYKLIDGNKIEIHNKLDHSVQTIEGMDTTFISNFGDDHLLIVKDAIEKDSGNYYDRYGLYSISRKEWIVPAKSSNYIGAYSGNVPYEDLTIENRDNYLFLVSVNHQDGAFLPFASVKVFGLDGEVANISKYQTDDRKYSSITVPYGTTGFKFNLLFDKQGKFVKAVEKMSELTYGNPSRECLVYTNGNKYTIIDANTSDVLKETQRYSINLLSPLGYLEIDSSSLKVQVVSYNEELIYRFNDNNFDSDAFKNAKLTIDGNNIIINHVYDYNEKEYIDIEIDVLNKTAEYIHE